MNTQIRSKIKMIADIVWTKAKRAWFKFVFVLPFILLATGLVCVVFSAIQMHRLRAPQYDQMVPKRWGQDSDQNYRQISVIGRGLIKTEYGVPLFADQTMSLNVSIIETLREEIDATVTLSDMGSGRVPDNAPTIQRWADTYSSTLKTTVSPIIEGENKEEGLEAWVVGVSGHYTLFHPMEYLSGSFLAPEPFQPDSIVINDQLAWNLFRSYEVVEQGVEINGREYIIVGVVREGRHSSHEDAGAGSPRAYIYFDELVHFAVSDQGEYNMEGPQPFTEFENGQEQVLVDDIAIMVYEVVLPDPIRNIAFNDLKTSLTTYNESTQNFLLINNTDRFTLRRLVSDYFPLEEQRIARNGFDCPYWEISAQIIEDQLRLYWTITGASIIVIAISALCVHSNLKRRLGVIRV